VRPDFLFQARVPKLASVKRGRSQEIVALNRRRSAWLAAAAALLLLAACETVPPPADKPAMGEIAVAVQAELPAPVRRTVHSRAAEGGLSGAKKGAKYGALPGLALAMTPDPSGLTIVAGVALLAVGAPIGAIIGGLTGATSADDLITHDPLADVEGAADLAAGPLGRDALVAALAAGLSRPGAIPTAPKLVLVEPAPAASDLEALLSAGYTARLDVAIRNYGLGGPPSADSALRLVLELDADLTPLTPDDGPAATARSWSYGGGKSLRLSEWATDDGRALREELARAVDAFLAALAADERFAMPLR
jgi:hypothetical protein